MLTNNVFDPMVRRTASKRHELHQRSTSEQADLILQLVRVVAPSPRPVSWFPRTCRCSTQIACPPCGAHRDHSSHSIGVGVAQSDPLACGAKASAPRNTSIDSPKKARSGTATVSHEGHSLPSDFIRRGATASHARLDPMIAWSSIWGNERGVLV